MANKSVIKHSAAVGITNKINLLQRRAWNILLENAYYDLPSDKKSFKVNVRDLMNALNLKKSENMTYVKEMVEALMNCVIKWNVLGKDKKNIWRAYTLISGVELIEGEGILNYSYDPMLRELLYNPDLYARISLSMQNKFQSKHSLALYELCADYFIRKRKYGETPIINLEEFRVLMGIEENKYSEFKILNRAVIKPAFKEINKKSDLWADLEYIKAGRLVTGLKIYIKPNPNNKNSLLLENGIKQGLETIKIEYQVNESETKIESHETEKNPYLFNKLTSHFCLSSDQAKDTINNFSEDHIIKSLNYVEEKYKNGKIKNIAAYTLTILNQDEINTQSQFDFEMQEQKKNKQLLEAKKRFIESLDREYSAYTQKEVKRFKETLSEAKLESLENEVRQEIKKKYLDQNKKNPFGEKITFNLTLKNKLIVLAGITSFDEWKKTKIEEFEKK